MGTGWRRAFCNYIPRDSETNISSENQQIQSPHLSPSPSPRSCVRLRLLAGGSNPSTPRLQAQPVSSPSVRCKTTEETVRKFSNNNNNNNDNNAVSDSPRLECKTTTPKASKTQKSSLGSNPSSPRSPLKLSLFKNGFRFRNSCGICLNSVKTVQGTAIYTAECAHAFHFPCISAHVRKHDSLICPVCNTSWKDVPLLAAHKNLNPDSADKKDDDLQNHIKPKIENKKVIDSSPRTFETVQSKPLDSSRSYDDDEPLLSPRCIPIPEVEENEDHEDDEVDEFQGIFVNPPPSIKSYSGQQINGRGLKSNVQVRLLPESAILSVGHTHETYAVALRVKAPPPPLLEPSQRLAPIDLVTVLDLSGRMTGAKLVMLKRALRLVISSLSSNDRLSIVAFWATTKRLLPFRRMTAQGQCSARRIVDGFVCGPCGQGTSVGEALRKATEVLEDRRERNPVASIVLLSDGQDERVHKKGKDQRRGMRHESSTRFAHIEIPIHSFGFGESGGFSHEPDEDAFAKWVGGLLSVVVQDLRIQLGFPSGVSPVEISAIYSCNNGQPTVCNTGSVRLGDLYSDEGRELLVELKVPTSAVGSHNVIPVQWLYKNPVTQEVVYGKEQTLLVTRSKAVRLSTGPKIERLRNLFITTRAIAESRRLIEHNDYTSAHHLLASARALLLQSSKVSTEEYVRSLAGELAELHWRRQRQMEPHQQVIMIQRRGNEKERMAMLDENGEPLTPTSAWRAAEKLAKVAIMKNSLSSRVCDLHGFENARF